MVFKPVFYLGLLCLALGDTAILPATEITPLKDRDQTDVFVIPDTTTESQARVVVGQTFLIAAKANIGAGYSWFFEKPIEKDKLEKVGEIAPGEWETGSPKPLLGSPGYQAWKFKAKSAGSVVILLKMVRPWEKDTPPVKKHTLTVTIR